MKEYGDFNRKSIEELINFMKNNNNHFAFLIGAGTSREAGIPTAIELIEEWQKKKYKREGGNPNNSKEFKKWVKEKEKSKPRGESKYGFWFEQVYPAREQRRKYIRELVEGKEPSFGIIILASMMGERYCPVALTPNFDDLLYDAFYLFLEKRPLIINHDALAPEFRFTENRPVIIKLHGDYLYDNLKNLRNETERLTKNMEFALNECLREYGLIVVGYGGNDNSIMRVLKDADPSYGIWWCARNENSLSKYAKKLLNHSNTFLIKIKDSEDFFATLRGELDIQIPNPAEITERAKKREGTLKRKIGERKEKAKGKEKEELEKIEGFYNLFSTAGKFYDEENYEKAIEFYDKAIDINPKNAEAWNNKGYALYNLKKYDEAIKCYNNAIEINPEYAVAIYNKGTSLEKFGKYDDAIECYDKALEINPEITPAYRHRSELLIIAGEYANALKAAQESLKYSKDDEDVAIGLMFSIIAKTLLGEKATEEKRYKELCSGEFTTTWDFEELDSWVEKADISQEKKDYIQKIMNLLRKHKDK